MITLHDNVPKVSSNGLCIIVKISSMLFFTNLLCPHSLGFFSTSLALSRVSSVFYFFFLSIWHFHVNWNFIANCQLSHCLAVSLSVCLSICLSHSLSLSLSVCLSLAYIVVVPLVFLWALLGVVAVKVAHFQEVRRDMFHTGPISCRYIYTDTHSLYRWLAISNQHQSGFRPN